MSFSHYFRNLVEGNRRGLDALALLPLLSILSIPYSAVMQLRSLGYKAGFFSTHRLPKPVISIGNITVGGTGKTPIVALIARHCLESGKRVAVLTRGYGGLSEGKTGIVSDGRNILMTSAEAGDEPFMLAEKIPGLMVVVGADRYKAGLYAVEHLDPDIFILDDGFQHMRLHRDLNILLLDNSRPFGNGRVLPAGLLREPRSAAKRADFIICTRCGESDPSDHFPGVPFCGATHELAGVVSRVGGQAEPLLNLFSLQGVAFAGVAEPASFFSMLDEAGLNISVKLSFPDHCRYGGEEIAEILEACGSVRGEYLITTEKDLVKLSPFLQELGRPYAAVLEVRVPKMEYLKDKLEKLLQK
jgi:tetraacyldisaccharide 4'-kinase